MRKVAEFLRLIDLHDGQMSLTNVALLIVLVKLAITPSMELTDLGALFVALLSYQGKKVINKNKTSVSTEDLGKVVEAHNKLMGVVADMQTKVNAASIAIGVKQSR